MGCQSTRGKVYGALSTMDQYFISLDKLLCSKDCKCSFNEYSQFMYNSNPIYKEAFDKYEKEGSANRVTDCTGYDALIENFAKDDSAYRKGLADGFKVNHFRNYWKRMEEEFKCTGVCETSYTYKKSLTDKEQYSTKIRKFLFSDINNGIPKYNGCMSRIQKFIRKMMISFGSLGLATGVIEILLVFLGCVLMALAPAPGHDVSPSEKRQSERKKAKEPLENNEQPPVEDNELLQNK